MSGTFKDHFSEKSDAYSEYRPTYPDELFSYLASTTERHDRAWDCGTGSGQSAVALKRYYREVIGTDASENQIRNAKREEGLVYRVENAESTSLENASVDLITVAQALHWFDLDRFTAEVRRVLKPKGILAVWTYGLHKVTPEIDEEINNLYGPTLDKYWPPERKLVEEGYRNIRFPMQELKVPDFHMEMAWELSSLIGYLRTWSAVKKYEANIGVNPVDRVYEKLRALWGYHEHKKLIKWPLTLRVWEKNMQ